MEFRKWTCIYWKHKIPRWCIPTRGNCSQVVLATPGMIYDIPFLVCWPDGIDIPKLWIITSWGMSLCIVCFSWISVLIHIIIAMLVWLNYVGKMTPKRNYRVWNYKSEKQSMGIWDIYGLCHDEVIKYKHINSWINIRYTVIWDAIALIMTSL